MKRTNKNLILVIVFAGIIIISQTLFCWWLVMQLEKKEFANIEVERKYLVDINNLPPALDSASRQHFTQTYLNYSPEIRVRMIDNLYCFLTVKVPKDDIGLAREENEYPITLQEYEELLTKQVGQTIVKTRYELHENGYKIEVDIYSGALTGLAVAEVEFATVKKSEAFVAPSWFGQEVTSDIRYKNASLARDGMPD